MPNFIKTTLLTALHFSSSLRPRGWRQLPHDAPLRAGQRRRVQALQGSLQKDGTPGSVHGGNLYRRARHRNRLRFIYTSDFKVRFPLVAKIGLDSLALYTFNLFSCEIMWAGNPYWSGRFSTVDLLVKAVCFVTKVNKGLPDAGFKLKRNFKSPFYKTFDLIYMNTFYNIGCRPKL